MDPNDSFNFIVQDNDQFMMDEDQVDESSGGEPPLPDDYRPTEPTSGSPIWPSSPDYQTDESSGSDKDEEEEIPDESSGSSSSDEESRSGEPPLPDESSGSSSSDEEESEGASYQLRPRGARAQQEPADSDSTEYEVKEKGEDGRVACTYPGCKVRLNKVRTMYTHRRSGH